MKVSLKNIIVPSIPLAVLSVGFCFVLWMSAFVGERITSVATQNSFLVQVMQSLFSPNSLVSYLLSFSFNLLNAYLLAQLNNKFTFIRARTFLPILIFLLLMGTWNDTHIVNGSHISLTLFILSLFYFFGMYRNEKGAEQSYMGSFLLSTASLLINPLLFIIPVFWIGFIMFQSFSLRTLLASLFGTITPWLLYLAAYYIFESHFDIKTLLSTNIIVGFDISSFSIYKIIYVAILVIIMIINLVGMYSNAHGDAIHTRIKLNFLVLLLVAIVAISLIFSIQIASFLPIIALVYSILVSHSFTLKQSNFYGYVFLIFFAANILYVISKYFVF
ncbi:MAG: hypothetical protein WCG93_06360 [Paludibacter sp.]